MISSRFYLCSLSAKYWDPKTENNTINIASFVKDALGIERRIIKGVNLESERTRYNLTCSRIESAVLSRVFLDPAGGEKIRRATEKSSIVTEILDADYLNTLALLIEKAPVESSEYRIGASFFSPANIEKHLWGFQKLVEKYGIEDKDDVKKRISFYQHALKIDCGVVELQDAFYFIESQGDNQLSPLREIDEVALNQLPAKYGKEETVDNEDRNLYEILRNQVEKAIEECRNGGMGEVNFSNQPHNVITEVLHDFVYTQSNETNNPIYIQVIYNDGSQGPPFPLKCLPKQPKTIAEKLDGEPMIRVALMSMRHLDLDYDVDMAWFRNREVSKSRSLGETDAFCYDQSKKLFARSSTKGSLRVHLYQTGFQPAVIGFYRALVEELRDRIEDETTLEIVPQYYYQKSGYKPGKPWL